MVNRRTRAKRELAVVSVLMVVVAILMGVAYVRINRPTQGEREISIGVVGNADEEIWKAVQHELDARNTGIRVRLKSFQYGRYANQALANKETDLNAFQHYAFMEQESRKNGYHFAAIGDTYISPLNLYSKRYTSVDQIKPGERLAIPNDPIDLGRALKVLDSAGLITLRDPKATTPVPEDVVGNPRGLVLDQVDPTGIVNLLPDYAAGITNTNFIIDAGMKVDDAIYQMPGGLKSPANHPYVNIIVARAADKERPDLKTLVSAYHSKYVADAINQYYKGAAVPAFSY